MSTNFQRWGATRFYFAQGVQAAQARVALVLGGADTAPVSFALGDALANSNVVFLMFPSWPGDDAGVARFTIALANFLAAPSRAGARFAWFQRTDGGSLDGPVIKLAQSGGVLITADRADFEMSNVTLRFTRSNIVAVNAAGDGLTFTPAIGNPNAIAVTPPDGAPAVVSLPLDGAAALPLATATGAGAFAVALTTNHVALAALDVGVRYFAPSQFVPGYVDSLRYPIFDLRSAADAGWQAATGDPTAIALGAAIDPLAPLDATRTWVSFTGTPVMRTYFRNPLGQAVRLTPQPSARLAFTRKIAAATASGVDPASIDGPMYLAPRGDFALAVAPSVHGTYVSNLMCGASGVEYIGFGAAGSVLTFVPDCAAYSAATYTEDPATNLPTAVSFAPLSSDALTSWAYVSAPGVELPYSAQPESAVLHSPQVLPAAGAPALLQYQPLQAGRLPPARNAVQFPIAPLAGVAGNSMLPYRELERQVLSPTRRAQIPPALDTTPSGQSIVGATPQGLLLELDGNDWLTLTLAQSSDGSQLKLYNVGGALKNALETNELFLVISSPQKFLSHCSVPYVINDHVLDELTDQAKLPSDVIAALGPLKGTSYKSLDALNAAVAGKLTSAQFTQWGATIPGYAADFKLVIADWDFDLSPYQWEAFRTIFIVKFATQAVKDLVGNLTAWTQPDDFNDSTALAQQALAQIVADALGSTDAHLADFVDLVSDPHWNGVFAVNVRVPLDELPPQLEGLAAGIDPAQFLAHHAGVLVTPMDLNGRTLTPRESSLFAYLRYNDPAHLAEAGSDYDFKVLTLSVLLENSAVVSFASQIELMVNRLFGDQASLLGGPAGNNLIFNGAYQRQPSGGGTYVFYNDDTNVYRMRSGVLDYVEISRAEFVTLLPNQGGGTGSSVKTRFNLSGLIAFKPLTGFDVFSFGDGSDAKGGLAYSALSVDMDFDAELPAYKTFTFDASRAQLDVSTSHARPASLYEHFPIKLIALAQGASQTRPDRRDYMPVDSPLSTQGISDSWFALEYDINLGTPGALAASTGFSAGLITAWSASDPQNPRVYVGLSLPGVKGGDRSIPLQGVIKLVFGEIGFLVSGTTYILQLRDIAFKILSLTLPPDGQTNILLFGDPSGQDRETLGWYAAYTKGSGS